ncbi:DUF222 domain-containing protein [Actinotalea sp. M2MS4P-6]|uniref:HNH endonuclease signature motif containing protein n=1 Tax=Actinotalea sp. M2MS4P-6 TaxID=2983762 RepID=UPI0021E42E4D|nr:DUF222 domain-containing protein [Actinotalea sp. M2MS4P-6]MCV2392705.1 DUF222 domain-containing protein [Actinotalea sp. M2MS4P-6]
MSGSSAELVERIAHLRAEITELVAADLSGVDGSSGPALHAELHRATGQLQAFAARVLARVESDGRWSAGGARTFGEWEARKRTASAGAVRRQVELGHTLDVLPRTSAAVMSGELSLEHAQVLARRAASSPARQAALTSPDPDRNEGFLLTQAATMSVDGFRREVDRWATRVDAAAADAEHDAACAKEYLTLARQHDGMALKGFLTAEHGEALAIALRAVAGVPSQGDTRSREERQAAALTDAARLVLDRGLAGGGQQVRPQLLVHVPFETLQRLEADRATTDVGAVAGSFDGAGAVTGSFDHARAVSGSFDHARAASGSFDGAGAVAGAPGDTGSVAHPFDDAEPAELSDGRAISPVLLARLACDSAITRVVFGPDSAVLDVGRAKRTYSGQQRLAVIARDHSCRYPGCGAPPSLGEVHHVLSWLHLGETSVANGILLCWYHHDLVHRRGIRIARVGSAWEFRRHDGTAISIDVEAAARSERETVLPTSADDPPRTAAVTRAASADGLPSANSGPRAAARGPGPRPAPWGGPRPQKRPSTRASGLPRSLTSGVAAWRY